MPEWLAERLTNVYTMTMSDGHKPQSKFSLKQTEILKVKYCDKCDNKNGNKYQIDTSSSLNASPKSTPRTYPAILIKWQINIS